jgi:hypothetical protein
MDFYRTAPPRTAISLFMQPLKKTDMRRTVADRFAETLAAAGIRRIHGIVGDGLNALTDAVRRQGKLEG